MDRVDGVATNDGARCGGNESTAGNVNIYVDIDAEKLHL